MIESVGQGLKKKMDGVDERIEALPGGLRRLAEIIHSRDIENPVGAHDLAKWLETDERSVAASARELVMKHSLPIGSTRGRPAGYYWIRTRFELDEACAMYHETALELLRREAALKRTTIDALMRQMLLGPL